MFTRFISETEQIFSRINGDSVDGLAHDTFMTLCRSVLLTPAGYEEFKESYLISLNQPQHCAGASLEHENGFTKISLWRFENGCQLRLHLWPTEEFVDSRVHGHRWNLSSYIVQGEMTAWNFMKIEAESDAVDLFRLYDAEDGLKNIEWQEKVALLPQSVYTLSSGGGHYLEYKTMHQVRKPAGSPAISLMLSGKAKSRYSVIAEAESFRPKQRSYLTNAQIESVIRNKF